MRLLRALPRLRGGIVIAVKVGQPENETSSEG